MAPSGGIPLFPIETGDGRSDGAGAALFDRLSRLAETQPEAPALLAGSLSGERMRRAVFVAEAGAVAGSLAAAGVAPGDLVGVCAGRSVEAVVAMAGCLAAGAGYVPLDPQHAAGQVGTLARDAGIGLCLVGSGPGSAAELPPGIARLPIAEARRARRPDTLPDEPGGEAPACLLYTSGTTGAPKGVVIPRRAVAAHAGQRWFGLGPSDRVLHLTTPAADGALFDIWAGLLSGAAVAVLEEAVPTPASVAAAMRRHRVTAILWYAALHHMLIDHDVDAFESVRLNVAGGERMSPGHAARLLARWPAIELWNSYGPTEATVGALRQRVTAEVAQAADEIPLGTPYEGYEAFLLAPDGTPLPADAGAEGEIALAGAGLALGYHGQPAATAAAFVPDPRPGRSGTVYRTGDRGRQRSDGALDFLGRADRQAKVGGRRIELDGIEAALAGVPGVAAAAVWAVEGPGGARLAAAIAPEPGAERQGLAGRARHEAARVVGAALLPGRIALVEAMPLTPAGKIDRHALVASFADGFPPDGADTARGAGGTPTGARAVLARVWDALLGCGTPPDDATFFELGGNSLLLIEAHRRIEAALGLRLPVAELFAAPRFGALAARLDMLGGGAAANAALPAAPAGAPGEASRPSADADGAIAVIGMAARLPGIEADGPAALDALWEAMRAGRSLATPVRDDAAGGDAPEVRPILPGADLFDAAHFGIRPREADLMDPQARVFLELCRHALDDAGIAQERGPTAVFAGATPSTYLLHNLLSGGVAPAEYAASYPSGDPATLNGNATDALATRVAHRLGLTGPAMSVGAACASSLVAVAQAVTCLRAGQADTALAGGVSITFPRDRLGQGGGAPPGHGTCRPFDEGADGAVLGDGAGVVVLRRLADALRDGDPVRAVIRGVGLSNDGADRASFAAPTVAGQAAAIARALADSGVPPGSVGHVEVQGTATPLGDAVEVAALAAAYGAEAEAWLSTIKGNIGHADAASGVLGLIRTVMVLEREEIPPLAGFRAPNPALALQATRFRIPDRPVAWSRRDAPRRASVSSFGVGGTNAHVVLEEAPAGAGAQAEAEAPVAQILPLSARSFEALAETAGALADRLARPDTPALPRVAATLQAGRAAEPFRLAVAAATPEEAAERLRAARIPERPAPAEAPGVVFLLPGQGAQYPGMGAGLYASEPAYREAIDRGAEALADLIGEDIRRPLFARDMAEAEAARALRATRLAQPALYLTEIALARLWQARGIAATALVGHSVGEFAAAALAGVMSVEDGLRLVARRGALMQAQPAGAMLAVRAPLEALAPFMVDGLDLAATNAPAAQVVAGPIEAVDALAARLESAGLSAMRLHTSHAFHSAMMDPVVEPLRDEIAGMTLHAPRLPLASSVTGAWMTDDVARDPAFWAGQARACVNFAGALRAACEGASPVLVEVGPGAALSAFAAGTLGRGGHGGVSQSLPDHTQPISDVDAMASACASLWQAGVPLDWAAAGARARHVSLPGTVFRRRRHWVDPPEAVSAAAEACPGPASVPPAGADRAARLEGELARLLTRLTGEDPDPEAAESTFLERGCDSLLLAEFSASIARRWGVRVGLSDLLGARNTLPALARHLEAALPAGGSAAAPSETRAAMATPAGPIPLTEGQKEIWMAHQLGDAAACAFNETVVVRLDGPLDADALGAALADLEARHDALRLRVARSGESFDIAPPHAPDLPVDDISGEGEPGLDRLVAADAARPFALAAEPPLRARLARLGAARHALILTLHHIASDGRAQEVLLSELAALYTARVEGRPADLPPAPSFAAHARAASEAPPAEDDLRWWAEHLADPPPLPELPADFARLPGRGQAGSSLSVEIPAPTYRAARRVGAGHGCTAFATLFAVTRIVLSRLSGAHDMILGVPMAARARLPEPDVAGHCMNFLPVRVPLDPEAPVASHLAAVGRTLAAAVERDGVTLGTLLRHLDPPRDLSRPPLTAIRVNFQRAPGPLAFGPARGEARPGAKAAVTVDLVLNFVEHGDALRVDVDYNADLFAEASVRRWVGHIARALAGLAEGADRPAAALPLLAPEEERALVEAENATRAAYPAGGTVDDLFRAQVAAMPGALAVEDAARGLTLAEIDAAADAVAAALQARWPVPGARIAVSVPRDADLPARLLGILRAGHAYVPLDPAQPEARRRQVVEAARADGLLATAGTAFEAGVPVIRADALAPGARPAPAPVDPEAPAYIIFTSGSTGTPKGVAIPHRAMVNFLHSMIREPGLGAGDRLLAVTTVSFDISVLELFGPLLAGGTVRIATRDEVLAGTPVVAAVNDGHATVLQGTPTLFGLLLEAGLAAPKGVKLLAGGEPMPPDLAERLMAHGAELWNMYGPTETTVWSAVKRLAPGAAITIGRPIANTELHVLDASGRLLPAGAVGELCIGGDGLALGYFGRDDLTEKAFVEVTLSGRARRLYRTGDLARRLGSGEIVVLGRRDGQVKLRGYRIELGEIESHLRALDGIRAAAVDKRSVGGEDRLVAWIVPEEGAPAPDRATLAAALRSRLPDYMVPQGWAVLEALPQTANGKLDRKALALPERVAAAGASTAAGGAAHGTRRPRPGLESRIASVWAEVLGAERAQPEATLFQLGADSLDVFRIAARLQAEGLDLETKDLLGHPSIAALAVHAAARGAGAGVGPPRRPPLSAYRGGAQRRARRAS
ncbi:MAG: amino acid adenylation domain-containing protein [Paracoccaceae bacterium]|nr:amino acid adenylation domain-containing protein [Paracoccaceae bacterium]